MSGRLRVYLERRDAWIGCYVANDAVYVCPLPFVVIRWTPEAVMIRQRLTLVGGSPRRSLVLRGMRQ